MRITLECLKRLFKVPCGLNVFSFLGYFAGSVVTALDVKARNPNLRDCIPSVKHVSFSFSAICRRSCITWFLTYIV